MTEAQKILEMIENVSPDDTDTLNEIDARVLKYTNKWVSHYDPKTETLVWDEKANAENDVWNLFRVEQYTRSRDALKSIRPEGWKWFMSHNVGIFTFVYHTGDHNKPEAHGDDLKTEELAELHAIIRAIEWERNNDT